ncbi:HAMP domain-containing histidine kinase [Micromonospora sp. U56]|uniref:HAMP domain-containing sensor histidine kinase n=1 Tax=Micromonospora sp. U56 TaxID=2824900 RepID=UPI001B36FBA9|nr:ATP-binding protein [Micromonospora sp. U56]MBQ0895200.1 HAMP domain-containing histidine kinase [Micromonospora sp. U56]
MKPQVPRGLPARLFAAQALVVLVGAGTLGLVAAALGPAIFRDHLRQVSGPVEPATAHHVEEAYTSASVLALGTALAASLIAALAVSAYVARRLAQPVEQLAAAAADVSQGDYTARVTVAGLGPEFDTVATAFNTMAVRLAEAETTRRRLLADLGHELRTPLATIEAYVDAAEDGIAVEGESTWNVLRTQTTRLRRLAEDVAAVSRAEEHQPDLRPRPIAAAEVASAAVGAARPRYTAKGVALRETVEADVGDVDADPERMGQVLGNLLDNALRHTPPGGQVTVTAGRHPAGVCLSVSDTGEGISSAHLPYVFERFYRSDTARDRDHGGSGIGLAVAGAIVMQHGGRIDAASAGPGAGATFTITLPRAGTHRPVE